jgi:hypothetical protein
MNQKNKFNRKHQGPKERNFIHPKNCRYEPCGNRSINIDGSSVFERHRTTIAWVVFISGQGTSNSLDNNLLFFAEPGTINIDTNLESYIANAKLLVQKNQDLFEEYKKSILVL